MIEIHGAGFRNKGAQMMIRTVLERLHGGMFCIEPGRYRTRSDRREHGLSVLFPAVEDSPAKFPGRFRRSCRLGHLAPHVLCSWCGLVRRHDTQALVDISGYGFGDAWDWRRLRNFALRSEQYHRRGKPVVLLPQMLGPFEKPESAREFRRIYASCNLIYARDRLSLECARECAGEDARLRLAPDITIFTDPVAVATPTRPYACLVPNKQMLKKSAQREIWRQVYVERLVEAGRRVAAMGLHVAVVVHDMAQEDLDLAQQILDALGPEHSSLFRDPDPLAIKGYIAEARFIISSRFHSLVAALSTGVPVAVIGWGHKYDMLIEDFGMPGMIHRAEAPPEQLIGLVEQLADESRRAHWPLMLGQAKASMRSANEAMWREVRFLLGLPEEARAFTQTP